MKHKVILFTGIVLIVTGVIVSQSNGRVSINHQQINSEKSKTVIYAIGGGVGGLGLIFSLVGLIGMIGGAKTKKRNLNIVQNGVLVEGTITFLDKNFYLLVNKRPVYSIIEYTYQDSTGLQHTRKINNLNSDIAIRNQLQVGGKVPIKYSSENPAESVIVLRS